MTRITEFRHLFHRYKINAYIVPSTDEYLSEYSPLYARRLEYLTGFTGSNGIAVICENTALFFTDDRYIEQSKNELDPNLFQIFNQSELPTFSWDKYLANPGVAGYDPKLFTRRKLQSFEKLSLLPIQPNLVDQIWPDQPLPPQSEIYIYPEEYAGQAYSDKVSTCRTHLVAHSAEALLITAPDSICWLLNLRASDIEFMPLMLGLLLLTKDKIYLFIDPRRMTSDIRSRRQDVEVAAEKVLPEILATIQGKVLIDENLASVFISGLLGKTETKKISDPCQLLKACKNEIEIGHAKATNIKDSSAVCEFLAYLGNLPDISHLTEYDLGLILTDFRSKQTGYVMDSFPAICGFKENGAIIHYRATKETAKQISGQGLLLIDSGGQYMGGTTDITRVLAIGEPTELQKKRYTQVLKGHIALASAIFPTHTTGANLDILARQFLWQDCQDYAHSTGHGIGNFLSVHEGPQSISMRSITPLMAGMIVSNEPGYYVAGEFGIRIENLIHVKKADHTHYLKFEPLTLVPYASELIEPGLLTAHEARFLNEYYQKIYDNIYPLLSATAQKWLKDQMYRINSLFINPDLKRDDFSL